MRFQFTKHRERFSVQQSRAKPRPATLSGFFVFRALRCMERYNKCVKYYICSNPSGRTELQNPFCGSICLVCVGRSTGTVCLHHHMGTIEFGLCGLKPCSSSWLDCCFRRELSRRSGRHKLQQPAAARLFVSVDGGY